MGPQIRGYAKDAEQCPYMILVALSDVKRVASLGVAGTVAAIRRVMCSSQAARLLRLTEFASLLETSALIQKEDWTVDFRLIKLGGAVIDADIPFEDVSEFLEALKLSGITNAPFR